MPIVSRSNSVILADLLSAAARQPRFDVNRPWGLGRVTRRIRTKLGVAADRGEFVLAFRRPAEEVRQFPLYVQSKVANDVIFWSVRNGVSTAVSSGVEVL